MNKFFNLFHPINLFYLNMISGVILSFCLFWFLVSPWAMAAAFGLPFYLCIESAIINFFTGAILLVSKRENFKGISFLDKKRTLLVILFFMISTFVCMFLGICILGRYKLYG